MVVTVIIVILATLVLVSLNPAGKLKEAETARAKSELNQAGTMLIICITDESLASTSASQIYQVGDGTNGCGDVIYLGTKSYTQIWPPRVKMSGASGGQQTICLIEQITAGDIFYYSTEQGEVSTTLPSACPTPPYSYP